jgi:hypothetical protein
MRPTPIRDNLFHIRSAQQGLTLLGDRGDGGTFASLDQSFGSILQFLAQRAQFRYGFGDIMV